MSVSDSTTSLETAASAYSAEFLALLTKLGQGQFDPAAIQAAIDDAVADAIAYILSQINGMDLVTLALHVETQRRVLAFDYACDPLDKFFFEFFASPYTFTDFSIISGVRAVVGDDSMDCVSTATLKLNEEYVVEASGGVSFVVTVKEILSATRFLTKDPAATTVNNAMLRRTTWATLAPISGAGVAYSVAPAGGVYYSSRLNLDTKLEGRKAIVIRRSVGASDLSVFYRTPDQDTWTEAPWRWRRTPPIGFAGTSEEGYLDVEYTFDVTGDFYLKVVAASETNVRFILGVSRDTYLKGTGRAPATPFIVSPVDKALDVPGIPTLQASAYDHLAFLAQAGAQFQISTSEVDFSGAPLIFDSSVLGPVTGLSLGDGVLAPGTAYFWRVRFQAAEGLHSEWSIPKSFTTKAVFNSTRVGTPSILSPVNYATVDDCPVFIGSVFSGLFESTHQSSTLQIANDIAFTDIVYTKTLTSGVETDLDNFTVPAESALVNGTYFARIRHQGLYPPTVDSEWSPATTFHVVALVP